MSIAPLSTRQTAAPATTTHDIAPADDAPELEFVDLDAFARTPSAATTSLKAIDFSEGSKPGFWSTLGSTIGAGFVAAKDFVFDTGGRTIGVLGLLGFRYPVTKYREDVSSELTRGSRLSREEIAALPSQGFTGVINLCREDNNEQLPEWQAGLKTLHIPILDNSNPGIDAEGFAKIDAMMQFIAENPRSYVHCQAGKGRTGLAVACYQIAVLGMDVDTAVAEAKAKGMAVPNQEKFVRAYAAHLSA